MLALDDCGFELTAGEVHALVGENGAGKSTLMKILAGVYQKDSGSILIKGREANIENTRQAQTHGISIIHQELNLMKHLTAAQNIFLGREQNKSMPFLTDDRTINERTKELFEMIRLDIDPKVRVSDLTVARQQMVEIAKAISFNKDVDVLIMDEPTSALSESEIEDLFRIIRTFRDQGKGIVYISHRLEELDMICDRVTVMRDGKYVATAPMADMTRGKIIGMMVGREIFDTAHPRADLGEQPVVLEARHLTSGRKIRDVSFKLRRGEILGFAGLMGAGRTEVARALFGADPLDSGEILVNGKPVRISHPKDAVRNGMGYLSEDRKQYGLALTLSVEENTVLASFRRFTGPFGVINRKKTREVTQNFVTRLRTRTPGLDQLVKNLSGGNQQKVVIGKWLVRNCDILIFDEPTRGIDVGAKAEIYKLLNELADLGKSIIMISSELPEILRMSHRVAVMCEGRITGELPVEEATQEKIMHFATMRSS